MSESCSICLQLLDENLSNIQCGHVYHTSWFLHKKLIFYFNRIFKHDNTLFLKINRNNIHGIELKVFLKYKSMG